MRYKAIILSLLFPLLFACVGCMAGSQSASTPSAVWFVQKDVHGLRQLRTGGIYYGYRRLSLDESPGKLYAAAYYPRDCVLITISPDATVRLYEGSKLKVKRSPKVKAETASVRFTRMPGLVYLLYNDVAAKESINQQWSEGRMIQAYWDVRERLVLRDSAKNWHGIPASDSDGCFLNGCYRTQDDEVNLSLAEGKQITLKLPEPLDKPFDSGPNDPLAQSVFMFPGHGILCKTVKGWSLHKLEGKPVKFFPIIATNGWWVDPYYKDGNFYVRTQSCADYYTYRLDIPSGRLVQIKGD